MSIKKQATKKHSLTDAEFVYLTQLQEARVNSAIAHNSTMSKFLAFIAANRLGYTTGKDLQFEFDPSSKDKTITIKEIEPEA